MAAFINTNTASLNSQRNLNSSQTALTTSLQRLSSGMRINSAKDDAAGLAISERMTSQIRGSDQAARNANDAISLAQTAEGDLTQIGNNLQRMRELAVQSANASNTASDRSALDGEVQALAAEIDRVSQGSAFNGVKLLDGSFNNQTFQVGAGNTANDQITINSIGSARTASLGSYQGYSAQTVGTITGAASSSSLTIAKAGGAGAGSVVIANVLNDGKAIASAINNSGVTGLTATVSATTANGGITGNAPITASGTSTFTLNGTTINVASNSGDSQSVVQAAAFDAINAQSANTGVVAVNNGAGGLSLSAADGRNIAVGTFATTATGATAGNLGLNNVVGAAAATYSSTVRTSFVDTPGSGTTSVTISGAGAAGSGAVAIGSAGTSIAATNVLTAANANTALTSIDAALATVNSSRASLGAYQNRFASVVSSLQTSSENLSASRSRIQDTDFAKETASLTRGQILQQAGTAMLAQANSLPNGVLALLRG